MGALPPDPRQDAAPWIPLEAYGHVQAPAKIFSFFNSLSGLLKNIVETELRKKFLQDQREFTSR